MKEKKPIQLRRRGAWLIAQNLGSSWQMLAVHGPLGEEQANREVFRIETATEEILFVSRALGERGMRELQLESIFPAQSA